MTNVEITIGFRRETGSHNRSIDLLVLCLDLGRVDGPLELSALERVARCSLFWRSHHSCAVDD